MNIVVLNGSPKGEISVTMQYVHLLEQSFPQHTFEIIPVAQRIKQIERDEQRFDEVIDRVRAADGVLWAFPLYYMLVHGNYKRFIELIWERGVQDAFAAKYAAALSTSIHYYDHTAHNYVQAVCDDLDMCYVGAFSADMQDMLAREGRDKLAVFGSHFLDAIERQVPTLKYYAPIHYRPIAYTPGAVEHKIGVRGKRVVIVTDAGPEQHNLRAMVDRLRASFAENVETINLRELDIKGGCLGCLRCGYDNHCAYEGKDGYIDFYKQKLMPADAIVFAGAIHDRYLSSLWKTFFDRSFFHTHAPSLAGKQFGMIVSGPLSQVPHLRQVLEAWVEMQHSNLVGFVSDEMADSRHLDGLLSTLAADLIRYAQSGYIKPHTFLGLAGQKVFRDDMWGRLRTVFQADHRAYKRLGVYDFPQRDWRTRILNAVMGLLLKIKPFQQEFARRTKREMIRPYEKVVAAGQDADRAA